MALGDFEGMKGLSICFSLALLMLAHLVSIYLKRTRAASNPSHEALIPISNSLDDATYRHVKSQRQPPTAGMMPPALPVRPGQEPSGPDLFIDLL